MTTKCNDCGEILDDEGKNIGDTIIHCQRCNVVGNMNNNINNMKGGIEEMAEKEIVKKEKVKTVNKVPTNWGKLTCSSCKKQKMASGDRVEKYKGKKYLCRECKKNETK